MAMKPPELDATKVRMGVTGRVCVGPIGTAKAPTSVDAALTGYKELGYFSEDGVTESRERSTGALKGWQNSATVRTTIEEASFKLSFTMIETRKDTVELYYGATVKEADGLFVIDPSTTGGHKAFVFDVIDGESFIRTYIPDGEIVEVGETAYKNGEPIGYQVTVQAYMSTIDGAPGAAKKFYSDLKTTPGG